MSDKKLSLEISGIHYEIDDKTRKYVEKKSAKLIDFIPRKSREAAFASVKIEKIAAKSGDKFEAEIVLTLPEKQIVAKNLAENPFAAIDETEEKLRVQIAKYKTERRADGVRTGGIMARVKNVLRRRK